MLSQLQFLGVTIAQRDWGFSNVVPRSGKGRKEAAISTPETYDTFTIGNIIDQEKLTCVIGKEGMSSLRSLIPFTPGLKHQLIQASLIQLFFALCPHNFWSGSILCAKLSTLVTCLLQISKTQASKGEKLKLVLHFELHVTY